MRPELAVLQSPPIKQANLDSPELLLVIKVVLLDLVVLGNLTDLLCNVRATDDFCPQGSLVSPDVFL